VAQVEKNNTSRKEAILAITGRVPMGEKEMRSLNAVTPERRIIEVLLSIPSGTERLDMLTEALTPPEAPEGGAEGGRALHSSTFHLNLSRCCH